MIAMLLTASCPGACIVPITDRLTAAADVAPPPGFAHAVTASGKLAFVSGQDPASTLVQVAALFRPGLLVEVDAVAALPG
jgi:enamine deaminase RidA (YjgF/YER057c/UK114 family)